MARSISTVRLKFTNKRREGQRIVLEPTAWEYMLAAGRTYEIVAEGDTAYPLGIEVTDEFIVVSAFDSKGARLTVLEDGLELAPNG